VVPEWEKYFTLTLIDNQQSVLKFLPSNSISRETAALSPPLLYEWKHLATISKLHLPCKQLSPE
jgi:hypothetical protein